MNKFQKVTAGLLAGTMILSSGVFAMAQGVGIEAEENQPTFEATGWTPPMQQDLGSNGNGSSGGSNNNRPIPPVNPDCPWMPYEPDLRCPHIGTPNPDLP